MDQSIYLFMHEYMNNQKMVVKIQLIWVLSTVQNILFCVLKFNFLLFYSYLFVDNLEGASRRFTRLRISPEQFLSLIRMYFCLATNQIRPFLSYHLVIHCISCTKALTVVFKSNIRREKNFSLSMFAQIVSSIKYLYLQIERMGN